MPYDSGINLGEIFFEAFIQKVGRAGKRTLEQVTEAIRSRMAEEGKPVTYPVQWDSDKQRRAFFATNGFGRGIPYTRTGNYGRGWTVTPVPMGFELSNAHPAGAIGGMPESGWQSRIHRGRWNYLPKIFAQEIVKLVPSMLENLRIEFE